MATHAALDEVPGSLFEISGKSDAALAELAEQGLPIETVAELRSRGLTFAEVAEIAVPPRTLKHRKSRGERLTPGESERVLRVARVLSLADRVFGSHDKALHFLRTPDPNYRNRTALDLLRTEPGGREVEAMLWRIDDGMYS